MERGPELIRLKRALVKRAAKNGTSYAFEVKELAKRIGYERHNSLHAVINGWRHAPAEKQYRIAEDFNRQPTFFFGRYGVISQTEEG